MADSRSKSNSSDSASRLSISDSFNRAAGKSHDMFKKSVKVVIDVFGRQGVKKGVKCTLIQGEIEDDDLYVALCTDPELTLVKINYCQRALTDKLQQQLLKVSEEILTSDSGSMTDLPDSTPVNTKKELRRFVLNHDYLVLELQPRANAKHGLKEFYILAEKVAKGGKHGKPGIYIWYKTAEQAKFFLHPQTQLLAVEIGTKMSLQTIVENLKKEKADYKLSDANCWEYALATTKHLIKEAAGVPGTSEAAKDRLMKESEDLTSKLTRKNLKNIFSF